jgi:succinate dehydrogenase hydrophobic anchor subunit
MRSHRKGFFKLKCLSPLKMLTSPLFEETFGTFLFLFLSLSIFLALTHEDLGVLMIFEEKITSSKTSFQMSSIYRQWMHIPEWSYACQHN